jgi:hypothetical protein
MYRSFKNQLMMIWIKKWKHKIEEGKKAKVPGTLSGL